MREELKQNVTKTKIQKISLEKIKEEHKGHVKEDTEGEGGIE